MRTQWCVKHYGPLCEPMPRQMIGQRTPAAASPFAHPLCPNTYKNGVSIGNETGAYYP